MNILIINGNPKQKSFCRSLAESYHKGCDQNSNHVKLVNLGELKFDPILREGYFSEQTVEPVLDELRKNIKEADHIVFVYPNWWGVMPALLKGVLDRLFIPGFAFNINGHKISKLLVGKSASLLITMDVPIWYYRWLQRRRGTKLMQKNILGFCGVNVKNVSYFGPIHNAKQEKLSEWLNKAQALGMQCS